jgi:hypothetical protein
MCNIKCMVFTSIGAPLDVVACFAIVATGIQELESSVFGFLYSHAGVLKLMAIVDDLARMLSQVAARCDCPGIAACFQTSCVSTSL